MSFSINTVTSDGVETQFPVSFVNGIYSRDHVFVYVEDDVDGAGEQLPRSFTWINDGIIELDVVAPAGKRVTIQRKMNRNNSDVNYNDGAVLDEVNLDQSSDQIINLVQELLDGTGDSTQTTDLNMNGFDIVDAGNIDATSITLNGEELELLGSTIISLADFYVVGDTTLTQAWDRMITSIGIVDSNTSKPTTIYLGKYPGAASGIWPHNAPVQIPNGYEVFGGLVEWIGTDTGVVYKRSRGMFEAIGSTVATPVAITADIAEGANILTLASTAGMSVGDFVNIELTNVVDQTTGIFPLIYTFAKITEVTATTIRVNTTIDWAIDRAAILLADATATFTVTHYAKEDVPTGIRVKNVHILDSGVWVDAGSRSTANPEQPDYVIGPFYFQYCENIQVHDVYGKNLKCPLVQFREYTDCLVADAYSEYPLAISAGEGYTVQMSRGCRGTQLRIGGYETRHVCDFTSGNDLQMIDCWDDTPDSTRVSFLLHGRYESNIKMTNLKGNRIAMGAGFASFGNFIKNWDLSGSHIKELSGRGAIGRSSIRNTEIGYTYGSLYFEHLTLDNGIVLTGDTQWNLETRLSSPIIGAGLYITNASRIRAIQIKGFPRVIFDSTAIHQNGGVTTDPVIVDGVTELVLDGLHDNKRYKLINACESISVNESNKFTGVNPTSSGGYINVTDLTSTEFSATLSGIMETSYVGGSFNRPFVFEQGTGVAYTLNLQAFKLECKGTWDEAARIMDNVTLVGMCTGCSFATTGSINYYSVGTGFRIAFPPEFRCGNNYYADPARNYDNIDHTFTIAVTQAISASSENTVILTLPAYVDSTGNLALSSSFDGVLGAGIDITNIWQDGTNVKVRYRNTTGSGYTLSGDLYVTFTALV